MKSEDGWWVLRGVVRLRLRSSKKGSLEERKEDTRNFYAGAPLDDWNLTSEPTSALYERRIYREFKRDVNLFCDFLQFYHVIVMGRFNSSGVYFKEATLGDVTWHGRKINT